MTRRKSLGCNKSVTFQSVLCIYMYLFAWLERIKTNGNNSHSLICMECTIIIIFFLMTSDKKDACWQNGPWGHRAGSYRGQHNGSGGEHSHSGSLWSAGENLVPRSSVQKGQHYIWHVHVTVRRWKPYIKSGFTIWRSYSIYENCSENT